MSFRSRPLIGALIVVGASLLTAPPALGATQTLTLTKSGAGTVTSTPEGIACGPECATEEHQFIGTYLLLKATPTERSTFAGWTVVGAPACPGTGACEVNITGATAEVEAKFEPIPQEALTANTTEGTGMGTVTGTSPGLEFTPIDCVHGTETCEASYNQGAKITLTAIPTERSTFTGWSGGGCSGAKPTCEVTLSAAKEVKAEFTAIPLQVLTVEASGEGTVNGTSPGAEFKPIECPAGAEICTETYNQGATITLTESHNERTAFAGWSGGVCSSTEPTCEVTMSAAKAVKAEFTPIPQETLTVAEPGTGPGGGRVNGTSPGPDFTPIHCGNGATECAASYDQGATVTLTATPTESSTFAGWTVVGAPACPGTGACEVNITAATEVKANFEPTLQALLSVTAEGPGTVNGTSPGPEFTEIHCGNGATICTAEYNDEGAKITLTATSTERSTFAGWSGCDNVTAEEKCEVEMTAAKSVEAKFTALPQQTLTVEATGEGTVTAAPPGPEFAAIECGNGPTACEATYNKGATLTLTANRAERSTFAGWANCEEVPDHPTECTLTLNSATKVEAKFGSRVQETLTVANPGSGLGGGEVTGPAIECGNGPTACEATFNQGATVTLTATSTERSTLTGWTGCETQSSIQQPQGSETTFGECTLTLAAATEVKADFAPKTQEKLTVTVEGPGQVIGYPSSGGPQKEPEVPPIECGNGATTCEVEYNQGIGALSLQASPSPLYHVVWTGCEVLSENAECPVFANILAPHSVKAVFVPDLTRLIVSPFGPGTVSAARSGSEGGEITACKPGAPTCSELFLETSTVILTAAPEAPHTHVSWTGCQEVPSSDQCVVSIGNATSRVKAAFLPNQQPLTLAPSGPGSVSATPGPISSCSEIGGTCAGEYEELSAVTLTASPRAHAHLEKWTGCKAEPEGRCEVEIGESPAHATAVFAPTVHTLTVAPSGPGSISASSGAISLCSETGGVCAGSYIEGNPILLTATPELHQAVAWEGCTHSSEDTCEVTLGPEDAAVHATFVPATHALTLTKTGTGQGTLACNGSPCASAYPVATALTLTATPVSGSNFAGWSGGGCSGTGACHLTLESDAAITATFNAKPPPAEEKCVVPTLAGKTLGQARSALTAAHCTLGKVSKSKRKKGHKLGPLIVKSSSPGTGTTLAAGSKVDLTLGPKPKHKGKK